MRRITLLVPFAFAAVAIASACSDSTPTTTPPKGATSVLLTDAPFPYDSVTRVDVYIERIEASTSTDTTRQSEGWVVIAEPRQVFNLLDLQNGQTALLGATKLPVAQYKALRMTLDTRKSSVTAINGPMGVDWGFSAGTPMLFAYVERAMENRRRHGVDRHRLRRRPQLPVSRRVLYRHVAVQPRVPGREQQRDRLDCRGRARADRSRRGAREECGGHRVRR